MTLAAADLHRALRDAGVGFFTGVPDSLLASFCAHVAAAEPAEHHVVAANEGGAVAIAAGHHLATGEVPLVYLQNSGLGNLVNPALSLLARSVYAIPCVLLVGWRGEPGVPDEPQHVAQGRVTLQQLALLDVPALTLPADRGAAEECVREAVIGARDRSGPVAVVVGAGVLQRIPAVTDEASRLRREDVVIAALRAAPEDAIVVSTTGMISRELHEYRARTGATSTDFLTVGSMGHASSIALGVALARPTRPVVVLDGDGAALMHLGAFAVIGDCAPRHLKHVVLNNAAHDSVGGQPTAARTTRLAGVAAACGYRWTQEAESREGLESSLGELFAADGPALLDVRVARGARAGLGRPGGSLLERKRAFMAHVQP